MRGKMVLLIILLIFRILCEFALGRPVMLLMQIMLINKLFWNISVQD